MSVQSQAPSALWYTRCPVPATSGIAQHYGFLQREFATQDITLESIRASADRAVRVSHYDHSHPNMFREGGNVPPIWTRSKGRDTVVVGITWVDEEQLILVRGDSDIANPADLRGRRLGLPKHATQIVDIARSQDLRGLLTGLQLAGVARDEVEIVDLAGEEFDLREARDPARQHLPAEALRAGKVDAIYAKGAVGATLVAAYGFRPLLDINAEADPLVRVNAGTPRPITVNGALAREHPLIVARYLAVLLQTSAWAKTHPAEVVAAVAAETAATEDAVRRGFGPDLHSHLDVELSELYVEGLRRQKAFLLQEGFIQDDFNFDEWISHDPLSVARDLVANGDVAAIAYSGLAAAA